MTEGGGGVQQAIVEVRLTVIVVSNYMPAMETCRL
jgi:hypothetical protein